MALLAAPPITTSPDTRTTQHANQIPASIGLRAGEILGPAAPCYIKGSDGRVYLSNGTAVNESAKVHGWTIKDYLAGEPVTLAGRGIIFEYGTGMTPGATLYTATTAGRLDTAPTTGDSVGSAHVVTSTTIRTTRDS